MLEDRCQTRIGGRFVRAPPRSMTRCSCLRSSAGSAEAVAEAAQIEPVDQVIDVACGLGALTRAVRSRTTGRGVGIEQGETHRDVRRSLKRALAHGSTGDERERELLETPPDPA